MIVSDAAPAPGADLEAEYNNRAKIPEHPAIIAGWAQAAAAFRASHDDAEIDLSYGSTARQVLDIFWPGPARDAPIAMFIHGGYWSALDKSFGSHLAVGLLAHGVAVAMPSYDLCPQVTLAELTEQLRAAAEFLWRRHARRLLVCGHSAGGHLAAMLMATDWPARDLPPHLAAAGLSLSGLFDLAPLVQTSINGALRLTDAEARCLSPLLLPPPGLKLHAAVGAQEGPEYIRQSRAIAAAWSGTWDALPGHNHFTIVDELARPGSTLVKHAVALLRSED
jgi:arylformamidase